MEELVEITRDTENLSTKAMLEGSASDHFWDLTQEKEFKYFLPAFFFDNSDLFQNFWSDDVGDHFINVVSMLKGSIALKKPKKVVPPRSEPLKKEPMVKRRIHSSSDSEDDSLPTLVSPLQRSSPPKAKASVPRTSPIAKVSTVSKVAASPRPSGAKLPPLKKPIVQAKAPEKTVTKSTLPPLKKLSPLPKILY